MEYTMQLIQLTKGLSAKVDDEDYTRVVERGRWQTILGWKAKTFYAKHTDKVHGMKQNILLHRFVMGLILGDKRRVDHWDHDGLNCQKYNLRIVDASLNHLNRDGLQTNNASGVTGVYWSAQKQKWHAELMFRGKRFHLGFFDDLDEAKAVRNRKEIELWNQ